MSTKLEKIARLKELNVELSGEESVKDLDALLKENDSSATPEELSDDEEVADNARPSGIIVNESTFSAKTLPLIVVLPADASKAQIERAKILNAYAYSNPVGWESRKESLIAELEVLKDAPDPKIDPNAPKLSVGSPALGGLPE